MSKIALDDKHMDDTLQTRLFETIIIRMKKKRGRKEGKRKQEKTEEDEEEKKQCEQTVFCLHN